MRSPYLDTKTMDSPLQKPAHFSQFATGFLISSLKNSTLKDCRILPAIGQMHLEVKTHEILLNNRCRPHWGQLMFGFVGRK